MFSGTISNPAGLARLRISVSDKHGKRASLDFTAPERTAKNTNAPLVATDPALTIGWDNPDGSTLRPFVNPNLSTDSGASCISDAETDRADDHAPESQIEWLKKQPTVIECSKCGNFHRADYDCSLLLKLREKQRNTPAPQDDSQPSPMTDSECNHHYLTMHNWERETFCGMDIWRDPIGAGTHRIAVALGIEDARETRDSIA